MSYKPTSHFSGCVIPVCETRDLVDRSAVQETLRLHEHFCSIGDDERNAQAVSGPALRSQTSGQFHRTFINANLRAIGVSCERYVTNLSVTGFIYVRRRWPLPRPRNVCECFSFLASHHAEKLTLFSPCTQHLSTIFEMSAILHPVIPVGIRFVMEAHSVCAKESSTSPDSPAFVKYISHKPPISHVSLPSQSVHSLLLFHTRSLCEETSIRSI